MVRIERPGEDSPSACRRSELQGVCGANAGVNFTLPTKSSRSGSRRLTALLMLLNLRCNWLIF